MKNIFVALILSLVFFSACDSKENESDQQLPAGTRKIEVAEHLDGGGYTFLRGTENGNELWIAVRQMPAENGDIYYFKDAMEMKNFESKSINKTFESILFVSEISKNAPNQVVNENKQMPAMANSVDGHTKPQVQSESNIKVQPLSDGLTVAAINKDKASLVGKTVKVKGVVTKYNGGIMNRNWIHIQDGTSFGESVDITATSEQPTKVGDTVIIEGTVTVDKDFGAGYFYDVIIENAKITVEEKS